MGSKKKERFMEDFEQYFKDTLLEHMDDKDVQEKLFSILDARSENKKADLQEINKLKSEIERLQEENSQYKQKIRSLESNLNYYKTESEKVIISLRNEKARLCDELTAEKSKPVLDGNVSEAYSAYLELSPKIREQFSSMLGGENPVDFVLKGTKYVLELHERICMDWNRFDIETLKNLNIIFDCLFDKFCVVNSGYRRMYAEKGEVFDMDRHSRTSDSRPSGIVQEVILCGYESNNGRNAKSLVKVW